MYLVLFLPAFAEIRGPTTAERRLLISAILCRSERRSQKAADGLKGKSPELWDGVSVICSIHEAFHKTVYTQLKHEMKVVFVGARLAWRQSLDILIGVFWFFGYAVLGLFWGLIFIGPLSLSILVWETITSEKESITLKIGIFAIYVPLILAFLSLGLWGIYASPPMIIGVIIVLKAFGFIDEIERFFGLRSSDRVTPVSNADAGGGDQPARESSPEPAAKKGAQTRTLRRPKMTPYLELYIEKFGHRPSREAFKFKSNAEIEEIAREALLKGEPVPSWRDRHKVSTGTLLDSYHKWNISLSLRSDSKEQ